MCHHRVPEHEEKEGGTEKVLTEIMAKKTPKYGKRQTESRSRMDPTQVKPKEIHAKLYHNQTFEN